MPGASGLFELPVTGPIDEEAGESAEILGFNLSGSLPPLVLIRTWSHEIPKHRRLARWLGASQPVYSIAPPEGRRAQDFPSDADAWSDLCLDRLARIGVEAPARIGGWSFGGVIALELARKLEALGRPVALVIFLDTRIPKHHPKQHQRTKLEKFAGRLHQYSRLESRRERVAFVRWRLLRRVEKPWKKLRDLPGKRRLRQQAAQRGEVLVGRNRKKQMTPLMRAIRVAYLKYEPTPCTLPVAQFWTQESLGRAQGDASLGWMRTLRGPFQGIGVAGAHSSMFDEPQVQGLARRLARALRSVEREAPPAPARASRVPEASARPPVAANRR